MVWATPCSGLYLPAGRRQNMVYLKLPHGRMKAILTPVARTQANDLTDKCILRAVAGLSLYSGEQTLPMLALNHSGH